MIQIKSERKAEIINSLKLCIDLQDQDITAYFQYLYEIGKQLDKDKNITRFTIFSNVLRNETRLKILILLLQKEYCVCELEVILDIAQSSISHHLKNLEKMELIRGVKKGYFTHYEIIKEKFQKFINSFLETYKILFL